MTDYLDKKTLDNCVELALIRGRCIRVLKEVETIKQDAKKIGIKQDTK